MRKFKDMVDVSDVTSSSLRFSSSMSQMSRSEPRWLLCSGWLRLLQTTPWSSTGSVITFKHEAKNNIQIFEFQMFVRQVTWQQQCSHCTRQLVPIGAPGGVWWDFDFVDNRQRLVQMVTKIGAGDWIDDQRWKRTTKTKTKKKSRVTI